MGLADKVAVLINEEVERRVHEELCAVAVKISKLYQMPLNIVRKDILNDGFCMGTKRDGKICMHKAVTDGYCLKHVNEKRLTKPINHERPGQRHNHPYPSAPQENCPACKTLEIKSGNEVRELDTMM